MAGRKKLNGLNNMSSIKHRNYRRRNYTHWFWLAPVFIIVGIFLLYPAIDTFRLSFFNANSKEYVGLSNYIYIFTQQITQSALLNNLLWLSLFTFFSVGLGVVIAALFDRVRYGSTAKAIIFIPMAVSFVAAGVIWKFVYAYRPAGFSQIGILDAILTKLGLSPVAWIVEQQIPFGGPLLPAPLHLNNFALILIGIWMWTGFAMVILSAALKSIPKEIIEAARVDGASELQIFSRIMLPVLTPTIAVVATTLIIQGLKIFDIVWVVTAGNFGTDVVATLMYKEMFNFQNFGYGSALAVILLIAIVPIMLINIRRFRTQEESR